MINITNHHQEESMYHFQESLNVLEKVQKLRSVQEQMFSNYLHKQRRLNPRYYDITCKLKIDFISFSVWLNKLGHKPDETKLYPMFTDIRYNVTSAPQYNDNKKYNYDKSEIYQYKFDETEHEIVIAKCSCNYLKPYIIRLHDPTLEVLQHLQQYLNKFDRYHIKDIEFTYDFHSENVRMVYQYLKEHAIVSWRGKGFQIEEEDTFYGNNIRFAHGKGMRVYYKEVENDDDGKVKVTRMEMLYKRPILKKNGIHKINDFIKMDTRVTNKYLSFRNFNYGKFVKHMNKINHPHTVKEINNIRNGIKGGYFFEMNKCYKEWYKDVNKNLKEKYKPNYLYKNEFWDHFLSQCKPWYSFLDGDSFRLSSSLMEDGY